MRFPRCCPVRSRHFAIEEAHHAFDDYDVSALGSTAQNLPVGVSGKHPGVEIARSAAGDAGVVTCIEKVGFALEWPDDQAALAHRCDERKSDRGLADSAGGAGDHESIQG